MGANSVSQEKSANYLIDDDNISHYYEDGENISGNEEQTINRESKDFF